MRSSEGGAALAEQKDEKQEIKRKTKHYDNY